MASMRDGVMESGRADSNNECSMQSYAASTPSPGKAWRDTKEAVMMSRRFYMQFANKIPHDFKFMKLDTAFFDDKKDTQDVESYSARLFFLGIYQNRRENELLYVDVPNKPDAKLIDEAVEWKPVVMYSSSMQPSYSKQEELLRERKRVGVHGVTSYEISSDKSRILYPEGGEIYYVDTKDIGRVNPTVPKYLVFKHQGVKLDPKMSCTDADIVAYVQDNDIWVKHFVSGDERRLTFVNKGDKDHIKEPISAGVPSYVVQEEFDRYTGYWWQPGDQKGVYRILYEEVDESEVQVLHIFNPLSDPAIDSYRYPKSGSKNATVRLKVIEFTVTDDGLFAESVIKELPASLGSLFPWMEYIVRVEWLSSGDGFWIQLLDRLQERTALVYIPITLFKTTMTPSCDESTANQYGDCEMMDATETVTNALDGIKILLEEQNDTWINVHDTYYFYKHTTGSSICNFVWSNQTTGHRHLYFYSCDLQSKPPSTEETSSIDSLHCSSSVKALTAGDWDVLEHNDAKTIMQTWVNEHTGRIFFVGLKDSPLESHLYMVNQLDPTQPTRLTQLGYSHSISMDEDCTMFVTLSSSVSKLYSAQIYQLTTSQQRPAVCMNLLEAAPLKEDYRAPELFSYKSVTGFQMHGMIHKPLKFEPGKKYPTVLYVYGGPSVQLVTNSFKGLRYGRLVTLTALGYVVLTIDGRGSAHRGLAFEGAIKNRLGQIEIEDQVEGLQMAAKLYDCIDLKRVAIHGWSYGGYLSLLGLVQRPDVFKMALCGAPVTCWELYDTGYTERYLGTPESNPEGYDKGSVVKAAGKFPAEPNRVFLFHGVIDENVHFVHTAHLVNALVRYCRPYHLQVYPAERHGIRSPESNEHYEVVIISYLQQYL